MNWKNIKTMLIFIFLAANIFLIVNIARYDSARGKYDGETINDAVAVLASDDIEVDPAVFSCGKRSYPVYASSGSADDAYYESVAVILSGGDGEGKVESVFPLPEGAKIVTDKGASFEFGRDFAVAADFGILPDGTDLTHLTTDASGMRSEKPDRSVLKAIEKILSSVAATGVNGAANGKAQMTKKFEYSLHDDSSGCYIVRYSQYIGGLRINGARLDFIIKDGKIAYIVGNWCFLPVDAEYSSQLYDAVNILFIDKAEIDSARTETGADGESGASDAFEKVKVASLEPCYCVYMQTDKAGFFFIPSWNIGYGDGSSRVYNAVSGRLF